MPVYPDYVYGALKEILQKPFQSGYQISFGSHIYAYIDVAVLTVLVTGYGAEDPHGFYSIVKSQLIGVGG